MYVKKINKYKYKYKYIYILNRHFFGFSAFGRDLF